MLEDKKGQGGQEHYPEEQEGKDIEKLGSALVLIFELMYDKKEDSPQRKLYDAPGKSPGFKIIAGLGGCPDAGSHFRENRHQYGQGQ